jgi:beta-D-xylosidase 4
MMAHCAVFATLAAIFVPGLTCFSYPDCQNGPLKLNVVCDTKAAPATRATGLVQDMENNEKLANLYK